MCIWGDVSVNLCICGYACFVTYMRVCVYGDIRVCIFRMCVFMCMYVNNAWGDCVSLSDYLRMCEDVCVYMCIRLYLRLY